MPKISFESNLGVDAPFSKLFSVGCFIFLIKFLAIAKASFSSFAKKSETPEILLCIWAPPNSSSVESSLVAILTSGGPAKNTFAAFF